MSTLTTLAIILISLFSLNVCQVDQVQVFKNLSLTAQAQSGGLVISCNYSSNDILQTDTVTVNLQSVVERDINGTAITDPNHTFSSFSGLAFKVDEFIQVVYDNIPVFMVRSVANMNTDSTITVYAMVFAEEGILETGTNELIEVRAGAVKFMYKIENWKFCTDATASCTGINGNKIGAYLDLTFSVDGSQNATTKDNVSYELGNSDLILSQFISVDDEDSTLLPANYPLYQRQETSDFYTVRFPTFNFNAYYDPIIKMDGLKIPELRNTGLIAGIIVGVVVLLLVAFFICRYFKRSRAQETLMP